MTFLVKIFLIIACYLCVTLFCIQNYVGTFNVEYTFPVGVFILGLRHLMEMQFYS